MASGRKAKEFEHQFTLSQEQRDEYRQALAQQTTQADVQKVYDDAKAQVQIYWNKPVSPADYTQRIDAWRRYQAATNYIKGYTQLTGQLTEQNFQNWYKGIQAEYEKAAQREGQALQLSGRIRQNPTKALGLQTAAGLRVDDAALREATTANKLPGLLDEKTGLPTETAWAAWEKNRLRTAYQDAAQTAGQQQAAIAQRQKQQADEAERLEGVKNVLWRLLDAKEPQLVRYHDAIVKQQAKLAGISDYRDAADLQRQVETRLGRLGRIQDRTAARAADKAGEVRTARALEYQLDNPDESLDANALKWERDQAAREAAQGLTLHRAANFLRANHAYAQRRYTDEKWKDISAIRNDPTLSGDYQTALEATRAAKAAEEALGYIQSDLRRDGAVTRDTAMQARHIAAQAGITLPDDDAALAGYLARLSKQEGARLQYALAGLTAAGYDEKKLRQYIKQALHAQQMDEYTAAARESAAAHPAGTSLASAAANLVGGMGYLAALPRTAANTWAAATGNYDAYIPIDENANSFRATKYAQTVREEVARQLQEKYPDGEFLGQNSAAFLYDTGMSMLDNITQVMMGMGLMGAGAMQEAASGGVAAMVRAGTAAASPVSLGVMGLTTASQKLQELTEQGVDATTAYTLATAAGSIEVLTEKIGLDEFVNGLGRQTAATTLRQLGKQLGRQMLAEGTEEAASDILNLAADALVRWDQNDFAKAIEEKRRQGYNEGDAVWACIGDQLLRTAGSFAGGALSGAGFGLGGFAMNAASNTNTALGRAAQSAAGFADLQRAAEAYGVDLGDLTQSSSAQALGAMRRQVLAAAEQEAKRVDAFAKQKGYKKNAADALQTAFASYRDTGANGMTAAEFAVAFDTAYQEGRLDAQYGNPGAYLARAAQDGLTAGLPGKTIQYAYLTGTQDGAKQTAKLGNPIRAVRDAAAERRAQAATNTPKGTLRVIALDEDTATVQTADGKRVGLDKLAADSAQRKIILQAQDDGYGAQVANAMLDGYDGRMPPERYYEAYRDAMTAAWAGESLQSVLRDAGTALPAKSVKAAWETGREIAARDAIRERIGPAGRQQLDQLAPEQTEVFEKYYKAGLEGKSFDQARKEIGQADASLNSTLRAAVRAGARDAQGGFTDGRQNSGDGQGRQGSVDPGGRGTRVAEGAEHEQSGAGAAEERAAGEAAGQDTGAAQVSTKALGVPEGTDRATARVLTAEEQTPAQRAKAAEYAKAGAELVLIEGNLEIQGETGTMHARGARIGDRIIASVNDEGATWEQIARHEAKHRYFEQHPDAVQQEWERVTGYMDADSVEEWLAYYAGKYAALGNIVDIAYIQEEALCDLAAEIETGKATEKDYRALETVKERTQKNTAQAGRTKMSFSGKYWRPNLNKTEWELLHRHVEREIGDRAHTLDEATKWLYASEKGAQVFALYGIGDGTEATPLYAVGGKTAERRYKELQACMEEIKNGTDRDATTVNQWLDRVQSAKRNHRAHLPATGGRTAANRNDSVHGGPSERDRGGAFATGEEDGRSEGGTVYSVENEADAAAATETDRARKLEDLARELDDALKRNKALESVNRRLREQMKVTPPGTADPASLRRAAKRLSEEYGGALRQKDIAADLQKIWRLRSEQKRGPMLEQVDKLAAELVQHYLDKDNPEAETLREIKQTVRATKIYLTPELRGDLDREGGYQDFRRRNFGRIRLANSGLGVDQFYQELSEQWPAYFPAGIWNPADQLLQIADVIQDGTTVLQRSPMEAFPDGMTYMRNKVLWELGLVQDAKPTAADKVIRQAADAANRDALLDAAAAHEQEQMDKLDAWYREKLQKVKADREDRIQKVKDRYQERAQADRDWKAEQELKRRLLWHGNRLKRMGRTATPEQQAEIERIFGDINLACQRMTGEVVIKDYIQGMSTEEIRPEGYRDKADPRRTMSVEEGFWHPEVRGDKVVDVERLKAWYEDQKKTNPDFIADRRVEDILANWEKKQINTMSVREVQQLLDVALNIENEIRTQKKLIDAADRREVYQQVLEVIGDIESTRGRGDRNLPKVIGAVKDGGRWLVDGTLTPVRLLRRFTGYQDSDPLYRAALALQQGELKQLDYQRRAYARFEGFTKDRKFMDYLAGKGKQKPIEITGMNERGEQVTCRITPDMRVALYLHSKNYQNLRHIQRGGIEIPDYAAYVAGRYTDAYDKATRIRLAPGTVRAIGETMTTREKNYAEAIRNYYNTMSKAEINAVSVKLKGYEVAKVGEYYPIATNRDFVVKEFDAIKYDGSLESFGFLKERKEGGTPILLADATRTLERSIQSHAAYIGMAIPMRNFNKLRGVSILDSTEAGEVRYQEQSLMDTLRKQWGTNAVKRLETMVADLSGSKPRENGMGMLNRIRSNYAGAVLELNPSTGMKQLIAYPSAASVLGWDAMAVGLTKWQKVDVKLINRYTPLLWHRMQGFIDADLGDFAKNHGHTPRFLNWNQAGDLAVVKQIWKAAEWKVAHDDQSLLHDVEKWHKATAALFNRVVLESQANYTTMERGELLRTNNVFWRSITMFKTEPFQAFNVLYDGFANVAAKRRQLAAAQQLENEEGGKEKAQAAEAAYRAAKKRVAQAVPAVIASNLLEAAITFAWALFRGKDKDWRDEETDEITAASFFKKMFIQAGSNIAGIVPLGGQLSEAAQAAIFGDRYYGMETTEVSIIDDTINSLLHIRGSIANMIEAGKTEEEAERARKVRAARDDFFKTLWDESMRLSVSIGVPVGNGEKILKGIFRWAFIAAMGKSEGEYWFRYCTEKSTASGRGSADTEALFQAALDGDEASLGRMYAAMAKTKSEDSIQAAIRKRTKDAVDRGDVDLETAVGILQRLQTDKAVDDLYWDVRGWQYMAETGAESFGKYNILKDAIFSGGDAAAALQELEAHGVSREDAEGEIRSTIGQWYQGKSADGRTVDRDEAVKLLQEYGGNSKHDAEEAVTKWDCYVETGIDYSDLKQQYVAGTLSGSEAKQYLQDYGAKRDREADKQIKQWDCKKDTGIDFDDIKAEYLAGSIDKNKAAELRQKYGGSSEEDAQTLVLQWDCKKDTDIDYEDIKWALIDGDITEAKAAELWKKYGGKDDGEAANKAAAWKLLGQHQELIDQYDSVESLAIKYIQHGNGAPIADFFDYYRKVKSFEADRDAEGKTISGSRKDKVVAYIADLPLTAAQKDGLMLADNAKYKLDDMPW